MWLNASLQVLFKEVRYRPRREQVLPVMVHTNYHPGVLNIMPWYDDIAFADC